METQKLKLEIENFYKFYPEAQQLGRLTKQEEFLSVNKTVIKRIPEWYKDILFEYPLTDLEIGIPNDYGDEKFIGKPFEELPLMNMKFLSIEEIANNAFNTFPDYELLHNGVLRIGDDISTGEGIFICTKQKNPEVRLIFHDFGDTGKEVLSESELLLKNFTDIFKYGKLPNEKVQLNQDNKAKAEELILSFFEIVKKEFNLIKDNPTADFNPEMFKERFDSSKIKLSESNFIPAYLWLEWGINDSNFPISENLYERMLEIYEVCNLHLPEIYHLQEKITR
jgi:hypothetical protein